MKKYIWIDNLKCGILINDPKIIQFYKKIRIKFRIYRKILCTTFIILLFSVLFIWFNFDESLKDYVLYRILSTVLNIVTFVGVFHPISFKKDTIKKDIENVLEEKEQKRKDDIYDRNMSTFG